jgi:hypothetical protein
MKPVTGVAALPLTADEERNLRDALAESPAGLPGDYTVGRLLATLDAERARLSESAPLDVPASDEEIERWYRAFAIVSGTEASTFEGRARIYWRFVAEYAALRESKP